MQQTSTKPQGRGAKAGEATQDWEKKGSHGAAPRSTLLGPLRNKVCPSPLRPHLPSQGHICWRLKPPSEIQKT